MPHKPMIVLGLSAFYHDSAAAIVRDGIIVAAVTQERFSRKKNDSTFPADAAAYCLDAAGVTLDEVDYYRHGGILQYVLRGLLDS